MKGLTCITRAENVSGNHVTCHLVVVVILLESSSVFS